MGVKRRRIARCRTHYTAISFKSETMPERLSGFEFGSSEEESPVEVMTSFAEQSVLRLRQAVIGMIRHRTEERLGKMCSLVGSS